MSDTRTAANQSRMTPEEKREQRFQAYLNPSKATFESPEAEAAYKRRAQRQIDFYCIKEPDRVPVSANFGTIPAYLSGADYRTVSYDFDKAAEIWNDFNDRHAAELGTYALPLFSPSRVLDLIDYKLYAWPGHGLGKAARGYQFIDGEYMKADEYSAFLRDPSGFFLRTYLPRILGVCKPFDMFSALPTNVELLMLDYAPLSMPQMQESLETLAEAGREYARYSKMIGRLIMKGIAKGFPLGGRAMCKAPFDILGDTLRGSKGIMMDMFRQPDNVLAAMDRIADIYIESTIQSTNMRGGFVVFFPLHLGADGWMGEKQFLTFYWPPLKKVINALIAEGLVVTLFAEGSYNSRLDLVNEFPKGSVCWWFDQTDMKRAKQTLGANCPITGNVPSSLFVTGTPEEVKAYCRNLIEICAPGGGYMLGPGANADEAKLENVIAMIQAAKEYGVY